MRASFQTIKLAILPIMTSSTWAFVAAVAWLAIVSLSAVGCTFSHGRRPPYGGDPPISAAGNLQPPPIHSGSRTPASHPAAAGTVLLASHQSIAGDGPHRLEDAGACPIQSESGSHGQATVVDLGSLLELAGADNPQVNAARERIAAAEAQFESASVQWLPTLYVGTRWTRHDGQIQDTQGDVLNVSRSSLFTGGGVRLAVAVSEAYFAPPAAEQALVARQAGAVVQSNQVHLDVSLAYWDLVQSHQLTAVQRQILANMAQLDTLAQSYLRADKLKPADADRVRTELLSRQQDLVLGEQQIRAASARLARLVRLDPFQTLLPDQSTAIPVEFLSNAANSADLATVALSNRPELVEHRALVQSACQRLRQARYGPLLPSLVLDASGGGFGGGPDSFFGDFDGRSDIEAGAFWQFQNLGAGDRALVRERASEVRQAQWRVASLMDQVVMEAADAQARVEARRVQMEQAEHAVASATDAYQRSLRLFTDGGVDLILPIEVLQAINALSDAQLDYLNSVIEFNRASAQLQWSLGFPLRP